jgi:hypothetical protein
MNNDIGWLQVLRVIVMFLPGIFVMVVPHYIFILPLGFLLHEFGEIGWYVGGGLGLGISVYLCWLWRFWDRVSAFFVNCGAWLVAGSENGMNDFIFEKHSYSARWEKGEIDK